MELTDLSFVTDRDGKTLPKRKKKQLPRCFWNVMPTGDYGADCHIGFRLAMEYLRYEEASDDAPILNLIVNDMPRPLTGVEVGFLQIVGFAAPVGINRADRILRHWGLNPSEWTPGGPDAQQAA